MRLRACMGLLLLAVSACAGLPSMLRLDVDGRVIEVRQSGFSELVGGGWSSSTECVAAPAMTAEVGTGFVGVRVIGPDEIELVAADGRTVRLHRCA